MEIEDVIANINKQVNEYGYFINSYDKKQKIGNIIDIAPLVGKSLGKAVIIAESSAEEFEMLWGRKPLIDEIFYRMVKD